MKIKSILSVIAILATATFAQAEVVIYKGALRIAADLVAQETYPKVVGVYFVVDYDAHQTGLVSFYVNGTGKRYNKGSAGATHVTTAPLNMGKTAAVISTAFANEVSPTNYSDGLTFLRGVNATVTLSNTPTLIQKNVPRALVGSLTSTGASGTVGNFITAALGLTLDAPRTIATNNAKLTIDQALDDLGVALKAKGYNP